MNRILYPGDTENAAWVRDRVRRNLGPDVAFEIEHEALSRLDQLLLGIVNNPGKD